MTCPQCRKGDLFKKKGVFVYQKMFDMHENCSNCNLKYEREPGFWLGALWVSYPLVVIIELPFLFTSIFGGLPNPYMPLYLMLAVFVLLSPLFIRYGRAIWIHFWVKYSCKKIKREQF
jgi:uncharacterized protein (DUF983 family)